MGIMYATDFNDFYHQAVNMPPFDLSWNKQGFARPDSPFHSCQSALMPIMQYIASQCEHVTEFGIREGYSTAALAVGLSKNKKQNKKLVSYDIIKQPVHNLFEKFTFPCDWEFRYGDVISSSLAIDETDYLHIDDLHTYKQVQQELAIHGHKARRFLSFHDTISQGKQSLDVPGEEGILRAIEEYTQKYNWELIYEAKFNHGIQVYERS